ncbi:MAG TPA: hypothetical protein VK826_16360 [Bacteroidia bacterium]|nr:hypothetical protein [Bacteroidia bacterium]
MKKAVIALCLAVSALTVSATTFYDQLCTFNFNWKKYALVAPAGEARTFHSDREYIQAHLTGVETILNAASTDHLTPEQVASRRHMITLLHGYRMAGNFPLNYYRAERIPVFIDEHGTHCAVGYLMMMTGQEEMAQRISRTDNYVWVKDIRDPALTAWQQSSGLSVEELKLIQGAYDSYPMDALYRPDRYETPQMPICTTSYFTNEHTGLRMTKKPENIWCKGEGKNGVLNGKWEQQSAPGMPWIIGYYENGKRSGDWEEYYQGTKKICRTEQWRNDKLNGVRKRFDQLGRMIEEILFSQGEAVCKINYDLNDSLAYVRVPIDSSRVATQVMNSEGKVIACGVERIYNPGNLRWFQNIELTALNSAQITTQQSANSGNGGLNKDGGYGSSNLFHHIPLVQYKKEGTWMYYPDKGAEYAATNSGQTESVRFPGYKYYGATLYYSLSMFTGVKTNARFDSIEVQYTSNQVQNFFAYSPSDYMHLRVDYYTPEEPKAPTNNLLIDPTTNVVIIPISAYIFPWDYHYMPPQEALLVIKSKGQYNRAGERIGEWQYFTTDGQVCKTENYLIPMREEEKEEIAGIK